MRTFPPCAARAPADTTPGQARSMRRPLAVGVSRASPPDLRTVRAPSYGRFPAKTWHPPNIVTSAPVLIDRVYCRLCPTIEDP